MGGAITPTPATDTGVGTCQYVCQRMSPCAVGACVSMSVGRCRYIMSTHASCFCRCISACVLVCVGTYWHVGIGAHVHVSVCVSVRVSVSGAAQARHSPLTHTHTLFRNYQFPPPPHFSVTFPDSGPWVGPKPIRSGSQFLVAPSPFKSFRCHWLVCVSIGTCVCRHVSPCMCVSARESARVGMANKEGFQASLSYGWGNTGLSLN